MEIFYEWGRLLYQSVNFTSSNHSKPWLFPFFFLSMSVHYMSLLFPLNFFFLSCSLFYSQVKSRLLSDSKNSTTDTHRQEKGSHQLRNKIFEVKHGTRVNKYKILIKSRKPKISSSSPIYFHMQSAFLCGFSTSKQTK